MQSSMLYAMSARMSTAMRLSSKSMANGGEQGSVVSNKRDEVTGMQASPGGRRLADFCSLHPFNEVICSHGDGSFSTRHLGQCRANSWVCWLMPAGLGCRRSSKSLILLSAVGHAGRGLR